MNRILHTTYYYGVRDYNHYMELKSIFVDIEEVNNLDSLSIQELFFLQRQIGLELESKLGR